MKRQRDARITVTNKYIQNNKAIAMDLGMENDESDDMQNDESNTMEIDNIGSKIRAEYKKMKNAELQKLCVEQGLKRAANKTQLIDRSLILITQFTKINENQKTNNTYK